MKCIAILVTSVLSFLVTDSAVSQESTTVTRNAPPGLNAPARVGRYTRGPIRDYGTPELGVAYQYSPGDSTRATVYFYQRDKTVRNAAPETALREQANTFKQALEVERARGVYEDYTIAFEGPDSISVEGRMIPGYQVGYAFRRGTTYVSFFFLYAVGDAFVKVRGTVPESHWEATDIRSFARDVVARAITAP